MRLLFVAAACIMVFITGMAIYVGCQQREAFLLWRLFPTQAGLGSTNDELVFTVRMASAAVIAAIAMVGTIIATFAACKTSMPPIQR